MEMQERDPLPRPDEAAEGEVLAAERDQIAQCIADAREEDQRRRTVAEPLLPIRAARAVVERIETDLCLVDFGNDANRGIAEVAIARGYAAAYAEEREAVRELMRSHAELLAIAQAWDGYFQPYEGVVCNSIEINRAVAARTRVEALLGDGA